MARKLLHGIRRKQLKQLTSTEAHRLFSHSSAPTKDELRAALDVLEVHNYLSKILSRRRDSETWIVNPLEVRTWAKPEKRVA
jgi:hypothetical protein